MRVFFALLLSFGLITYGSYLLLSTKALNQEIPYVVVDIDPSCNHDSYLNIGSSFMPPCDVNTNAKEAKIINSQEEFSAVKKDQSLHDILSSNHVSAQEIIELSRALKPFVRPRDLGIGDLYSLKLIMDPPLIDTFILRKLDPNRIPITYTVKRSQGVFVVDKNVPQTREEEAYVKVSVDNTLYQSFKSLPFGNELMQRLMHVFAWRMRMPEHVTKNDSIEIIVNKLFAEGEFIGYTKIKAVIYQQPHRTLKAFYFKSKDKKIKGYYDQDGRSLEKEILTLPIENTIATSHQAFRLHPVIKSRIRHNGIDFRGSIGTEFFSIADGVVIEKRFDENVGNMIRIRHKDGIHSEYFHADSLVKSINVGDKVKRGQIIGAIGRTGRLCTGPHLHLGLYLMRGEEKKFIDFKSLRKKLSDMPRLNDSYMTEFNNMTNKKLMVMTLHRERAPHGQAPYIAKNEL